MRLKTWKPLQYISEHKTGHVHSPVTLRYRWLHSVGYNLVTSLLGGPFDLLSFTLHAAPRPTMTRTYEPFIEKQRFSVEKTSVRNFLIVYN